MSELPPLDEGVLPSGVRSRFVDGINACECTFWRRGLSRMADR